MALPFGPSDGKEIPEETETIGKTSTQILAYLLLNISPEKYEAISQLDIEQIEALGEDTLASEKMTLNKVEVIQYELTVADILLITPTILKTLTEEELNKIILEADQIQFTENGKLQEITRFKMGPFTSSFHEKNRTRNITQK